MVLTKAQVLTFLTNKKRKHYKGSGKYYIFGAMRILVQKDLITVDDIIAEFPELNTS